MDQFEHRRRLDHIKALEAEGKVADSMEYRRQLIARLDAGEITFEQMQAELKRTKRNAKAGGMITRARAFHGHRP